MRTFEGTARVRFDVEANRVFLDRGIAGSTLTASDVDRIVEVAVEAATKQKAGLCRWSFYVAEASEKLAKDAKVISPVAVTKALKAGFKATLVAAKWGKPAVWITPAMTSTKAKVSKYQDLA